MIETIETIILGALAGYITNDIAITMLFDEIKIGPLSVGGVIVKTRDEFEEKIAEMIERDIVTHHSLSQELENEEFKKNLITVFSEYFNYTLVERIQDLKLSDIPDFTKSEENCRAFLEETLPGAIQGFLDLTLDHMMALNVVSDEQIIHIQEQLTLLVKKTLTETPLLEEYIVGLYTQVENDPLVSIIPENAIKSFSKLSYRISAKKVLAEVFEEISRTISLQEKTEEFTEDILRKRIKDILGEEQSKNLLRNIEDNLNSHFNTPEGEQGLLATAEACADYLKNLDVTLTTLLSPFFRDELENFLEKQLPLLLEELITWVRKKETAVDKAIEEAIDESISSYDPMKRTLLEGIRKNFLQDTVKKFQIIERIVGSIEKTKNDKVLAKEFSDEIIEKLNSMPISQFFTYMDPTELIFFYMKNNINNIGQYLPSLLNIHLDKIVPKSASENLLSLLKDFLLNSKNIDNFFHDEIQKGLLNIKGKVMRDIFPREVLVAGLPEIKESLISIIKVDTGIKRYLSGTKKPLSSMLDFSTKTLISKEISKGILTLLSSDSKNWSNMTFSTLLDEIKKNPNLEKDTADFLISTLDTNLEYILEGNVSSIVEENLKKLSNVQMKEMMREFMGKELKPINLFGALLGGVIGGASSFIPVPKGVLYSSLLQIPIYSVVGYLTNVLAIQGLFRPYKKTLGISGVIPKEKPRFAKKMGEFVDKELLRRETAIEMFQSNKEHLLNLLKKRISKDNFKVLQEALDYHSEEVYNYFIDVSSTLILKNREDLRYYLAKNILEINFDDEMMDRLDKSIGMFKELSSEIIRTDLKRFIYTLENSEVPLSTIITPHIQGTLDKLMKSKLASGIGSLNDVDWKKVLEKTSENELKDIDQSILDRTFQEILGTDVFPWKTFISANEESLQHIINSIFQEALNASGEFLSDIIAKKLKDGIASQSLPITESTINYVTSQLSFMQKIGYTALGGDKIIENIVDRFISVKMPELIDDSIDEIREYIDNVPKEQLNVIINKDTLPPILDSLIDSLPLQNFTEAISKKTPREIMAYACLYDLGDLVLLFQKEISSFFETITEDAEAKKDEITDIIFPVFRRFVDDDVLTLKLKDFLKTIQVKDKIKISYKISNLLLKSELYDEYFDALIRKTIYSLHGEKLNIFLNQKDLETSLDGFIKEFFSRKDELSEIYYSQRDIPKNILSGLLNNVEGDSKEYVLNLLLNPFLTTLNSHIPQLLSSLNIGEITEEAINNMESQDLHKLFNSFAEPYFRKLEVYGLWGGLFAIPGLNILIFIQYLFFLRKQKKLAK